MWRWVWITTKNGGGNNLNMVLCYRMTWNQREIRRQHSDLTAKRGCNTQTLVCFKIDHGPWMMIFYHCPNTQSYASGKWIDDIDDWSLTNEIHDLYGTAFFLDLEGTLRYGFSDRPIILIKAWYCESSGPSLPMKPHKESPIWTVFRNHGYKNGCFFLMRYMMNMMENRRVSHFQGIKRIIFL